MNLLLLLFVWISSAVTIIINLFGMGISIVMWSLEKICHIIDIISVWNLEFSGELNKQIIKNNTRKLERLYEQDIQEDDSTI